MPPLSPVPEDDLPPPHGSVYTYPTPASPAHSRPPPPDMMIYDGPGSKESILASEYAPGRLHEIGGEYYGPRLRGLDTEASSLSDDIEERPYYRRPVMIALYVLLLFVIIAVSAALGVIYS